MIRNFAFYSYVHFFLIHSFLSNLWFVNGLSFISVNTENTVWATQEQNKIISINKHGDIMKAKENKEGKNTNVWIIGKAQDDINKQ